MLTVHNEPQGVLPAPSQNGQSAVVIGLGRFGRDVLVQLVARRQCYADDSSVAERTTDSAVHTLTLYDQPEPDATAVDIRTAFLKTGLLDTRARIAGTIRAATAHAEHLAVPHLEPVIYIVGATWEPTGSALLWPIAHLIDRILGWHIDHHVIGIFTSAHHAADPQEQEQGSALTFATFVEGDTLRQSRCDWEFPINQLLPREHDTVPIANRCLYDQIYLLDTLKSNNTTVLTGDASEIVLATTMLIEGLVSAPVRQVVETAVLDDFGRCPEQVYTGVGIAALMVSAGEIRAVVEQDVLAALVTDRLFPPVGDAALRQTVDSVINGLEHRCYDYYRSRLSGASGKSIVE